MTTAVSDTPSEARLRPALWGEFAVTKPDDGLRFITPVGLPGEPPMDDGVDILEELGE